MTNLVHIKNNIRTADELSLDEYLWKCWPVAANAKCEVEKINNVQVLCNFNQSI